MHTLHKLSLSTIALVAAVAVSATPVSADFFQQQSQSFSSETSFSSSCEGNGCGGKHEFKSTTTMNQEQRQGSGTNLRGWGDSPRWSDWDDEDDNTSGEVKITWSMRDGTCYIQYRKVGDKGWPYSTEANCNDGSKTIGGLQEGKSYQFRVKKNDGAWSRLITRRAQ